MAKKEKHVETANRMPDAKIPWEVYKSKRRRPDLAEWRTIENDKEKYAAYLCSREWGVLKEAVRKRSKGICERCKVLPQDATHHLTYERKYSERIEDVQAICTPCHEFTHGKANADPALDRYVLRYIIACVTLKANAVPIGILFDCENWTASKERNELFAIRSVYQLDDLHDHNSAFTPFEAIADKMQDGLGLNFDFNLWLRHEKPTWTQHWSTYDDAIKIIGRYVKCGSLDYEVEEDEDGA